jgi:hypothetical protein
MEAASFYGAQRNKRYSGQQETAPIIFIRVNLSAK